MPRLDLEQQRKRAKDLKRAHARGDADAAERVAQQLPRLRGATLALTEAQLVVAREAGFASWPAMRKALATPPEDALAAALRGDPVDRDAVRRSIHLAAAAADVEAVAALLAEESTPAGDAASSALANHRDAVRGWTPLLYTCCGRGRAEERVAIARMLLDRGADPDALAHEPGLTSPNVGVLGDHEWRPIEGAAARVASVELVKVLLARGARLEKTGRFLSHCVRGGDIELLRAGLAADPPWYQVIWALVACVELDRPDMARLLVAVASLPKVPENALLAAIRLHRERSFVEILLGDAPTPSWPKAYRAAARHGHADALALLRARGLGDDELSAADRAIAGCVGGAARSPAGNPVFDVDDHRMLSWAIRSGRLAAVPCLLAIGLDPNIADRDGATPLHLAARAGAAATIDALLDAGARREQRDYEARTALDILLGRDDAPDELARKLAPATDDDAADIAAELFERAADAVAFGDLATLRTLLDDEPALVHARSPRPHRATLLNYCGANGSEDPRQRTPPNAPAIAELLLERGAEPDATCNFYGGGITTLDLLLTSAIPRAAKLDGGLVRVLAAGGATVRPGDLATAILYNSPLAGAALLDAGVPVDDIFSAAGTNRTDLLRELIHAGADVNARFHGGCTALHAAAAMNQREAVEILLAHGADREIRDHDWDNTPAGWARHFEHDALADRIDAFARST